MIDDLRFMIAGGAARNAEHFGQLESFKLQFFHPLPRHERGAPSNFDPQIGFVCFFQEDRDFVDEGRARFPSQCGAMGRRHGPAARYPGLPRSAPTEAFVGNRLSEFENEDGESPPALPTQHNHQS